jgi:proteasome lid subunit RPN8/RPN11
MIEAGVVINKAGEPIHWHMPRNRTNVALPDSRNLWDVLWDNRENLLGFAHSHPGAGVPGPSYTDVTTFSAVELALGKRLDWWITSSDSVVVVRYCGPKEYSYQRFAMDAEPSWTNALRALSLDEVLQLKSNVEGKGQHER